MLKEVKLPTTSCWESPTVKENVIFYSLAYPVAESEVCTRCSVQNKKRPLTYCTKQGVQMGFSLFLSNLVGKPFTRLELDYLFRLYLNLCPGLRVPASSCFSFDY
jgi:hypothetical protein